MPAKFYKKDKLEIMNIPYYNADDEFTGRQAIEFCYMPTKEEMYKYYSKSSLGKDEFTKELLKDFIKNSKIGEINFSLFYFFQFLIYEMNIIETEYKDLEIFIKLLIGDRQTFTKINLLILNGEELYALSELESIFGTKYTRNIYRDCIYNWPSYVKTSRCNLSVDWTPCTPDFAFFATHESASNILICEPTGFKNKPFIYWLLDDCPYVWEELIDKHALWKIIT